jgi:flagellar biosynthetic protein FliP
MKCPMQYSKRRAIITGAIGIFSAILLCSDLFTQIADAQGPALSLSVGGSELASDGSVSSTIKITLLLTLLTFAPAIMLTTTSFTRIAVVLGMTRTTIGTQSAPPNTVITGLALFLTIGIMQPVFMKMYGDGIRPFLDGTMSQEEAFTKAGAPLRKFLVQNTREKDIALFLEVTRSARPKTADDVPLHAAIPAFVISELNTAFQIGFMIALPFLVLDMVVSSVLTAMSMITLPPVIISLPLKLMLFVLVDGWHLIITSLVRTYNTGGI